MPAVGDRIAAAPGPTTSAAALDTQLPPRRTKRSGPRAAPAARRAIRRARRSAARPGRPPERGGGEHRRRPARAHPPRRTPRPAGRSAWRRPAARPAAGARGPRCRAPPSRRIRPIRGSSVTSSTKAPIAARERSRASWGAAVVACSTSVARLGRNCRKPRPGAPRGRRSSRRSSARSARRAEQTARTVVAAQPAGPSRLHPGLDQGLAAARAAARLR